MIVKKLAKPAYYFVFSYFLLWIILFEFILPVNKILPKPSIVLESFGALWTDYQLPLNYISTVGVIYISMVLAYFFVKILSPYLIEKQNIISAFINSVEWFSEYIPGIAIGLLLIFWFPESEYIEFVFAFAAAFTSIMIKFQNESLSVNQSYIDAAQSLGVNDNQLNRSVIWKDVQPRLMEHIFQIHYYVWSMLIAFEFIKDGNGLGIILRRALEFRDLSALFSVLFIMGLTIWVGTLILRYIRDKFFFWSIK
jgi:ABC-type nitrate/sulfonate/bicarbonate transport system permease component